MGIAKLKQEGYNISTETVSGATVASEALAANRGQFTSNQAAAEAAAANKGAAIKIILATTNNPTDWVTAPGYENCSSLSGKPVGIYALTGSSYTQEMQYYFQKNCPGVKADLVTIPDSGLRAQALANKRIVASVLATSDADALTSKLAPSTKWNVVSLSKAFPGLGDTYLYANGAVLEKDPQAAAALVQADLQGVRQIYANPSSVAGLVKTYFGTSSAAPSSASATQALVSKLWYANGGLGATGVAGLKASLKVFQVPGNAQSLVDQTPLQTALTAIGRSSTTAR
jgi:ABC-type nitrate/sulfonate/bicarbonate transport system substrate-binding protein